MGAAEREDSRASVTLNGLSVCTAPQDKEPRGIIPLENLSIREVEDSKKPVSVSAERKRRVGKERGTAVL